MKSQVIKDKYCLLTVELNSVNSILITQMGELNAEQRKELNFMALGSVNKCNKLVQFPAMLKRNVRTPTEIYK